MPCLWWVENISATLWTEASDIEDFSRQPSGHIFQASKISFIKLFLRSASAFLLIHQSLNSSPEVRVTGCLYTVVINKWPFIPEAQNSKTRTVTRRIRHRFLSHLAKCPLKFSSPNKTPAWPFGILHQVLLCKINQHRGHDLLLVTRDEEVHLDCI